MPPKNSRNQVGLGRAIINRKVKDARAAREDTDKYTTDLDTGLQSITQERNLDEFLNTAQLAGTEFTAERQNITIIQNSAVTSVGHNPYLLSSQEEKETLRRHAQNKDRLRVPRRPPWTRDLTTSQLERQEREAFLEWRRSIAQLQEAENFLLTPFERNIAVWRQLWRVLERAHLVVQIVDARNPLRFRCADLDSYVHDVEGPEGEEDSGPKGLRRCLLLVNKADLLTADQRREWADYFEKEGIQFAFFSAANAKALQEAKRLAEEATFDQPQQNEDNESEDHSEIESEDEVVDATGDPAESHTDESTEETAPHATHLLILILTTFLSMQARQTTPGHEFCHIRHNNTPAPSKLVVGLVGYPNVGKSSTINALLGEKKVSVSIPQFATTKAALVCDGVLPIDQMREHIGPIGLVVRRIPRGILEGTYGLRIRRRDVEDGGDGDGEQVTAEDLLVSYAIARGFARAGQGLPDEARAARYILKDYVAGKLLFCHPPPGLDEDAFNARSRQLALERLAAAGKKMAPATRVGKNADTFLDVDASAKTSTPGAGSGAGKVLDREFFEQGSELAANAFVKGGKAFMRSTAYPHQNSIGDDGRMVRGGIKADEAAVKGKKHNKGNKRAKQRSGKGYD
ncbi:P-loop containing nucleoside triphosphate hydrolase protein [Rhizoctonia solani]|uniref:P-loop containing nucleoside triphosphate hydrolase protein n=1 Tax=Rhizoctonia solani TaxID=456999 RepID=A0A8H7IF30_9AGAM|nr:P-loop containing nucleoside triphosphate hydrolase protein [Rhizoctonia solani]